MEKYTWYVLVTKDVNDKFDVTALRYSNDMNILNIIEAYTGPCIKVVSLNACDSKHKAIEIAKYWVDSYKRKGAYRWN